MLSFRIWNKALFLQPHLWTLVHDEAALKEVWVSGWNHRFAKLTCGLPYRGFESPRFRSIINRSVHLTVRIQDSQSWHTSSILVPTTIITFLVYLESLNGKYVITHWFNIDSTFLKFYVNPVFWPFCLCCHGSLSSFLWLCKFCIRNSSFLGKTGSVVKPSCTPLPSCT